MAKYDYQYSEDEAPKVQANLSEEKVANIIKENLASSFEDASLKGEKHMRHMPTPTSHAVDSPIFNAIFQEIKTWDVMVDGAYEGYCHATGSHVQLILDSLRLHDIKYYSHKDEARQRMIDMLIETTCCFLANISINTTVKNNADWSESNKKDFIILVERFTKELKIFLNLLDVHTHPSSMAPV